MVQYLGHLGRDGIRVHRMNTSNPNQLREDAFQYNWLWPFWEQFECFFHVFGTATVRFQIEHADRRVARADVLQHPFNQVDHEQRQVGSIRYTGRIGDHEILQPPILFGVAEVELQLETYPVIVDQGCEGQRQITTEQDDLRLCLRRQIGFDDHYHVQE